MEEDAGQCKGIGGHRSYYELWVVKIEPEQKRIFCQDYGDTEFTSSWFDWFKKHFSKERGGLNEIWWAEFALPVSISKQQALTENEVNAEVKRLISCVPAEIRNHPDISAYDSSDGEHDD